MGRSFWIILGNHKGLIRRRWRVRVREDDVTMKGEKKIHDDRSRGNNDGRPQAKEYREPLKTKKGM